MSQLKLVPLDNPYPSTPSYLLLLQFKEDLSDRLTVRYFKNPGSLMGLRIDLGLTYAQRQPRPLCLDMHAPAMHHSPIYQIAKPAQTCQVDECRVHPWGMSRI